MNKIGIFGGSFNPLHNGHINSMLSVKEKMQLDSIRVIPTFESPNRKKLRRSDSRSEIGNGCSWFKRS